MSENFHGKGPDVTEMGVRACLRFDVISYTDLLQWTSYIVRLTNLKQNGVMET